MALLRALPGAPGRPWRSASWPSGGGLRRPFFLRGSSPSAAGAAPVVSAGGPSVRSPSCPRAACGGPSCVAHRRFRRSVCAAACRAFACRLQRLRRLASSPLAPLSAAPPARACSGAVRRRGAIALAVFPLPLPLPFLRGAAGAVDRGLELRALGHLHARAFAQAIDAVDHDAVARLEALQHRHPRAVDRAERHRARGHRHVFLDHVDEQPAPAALHRRLQR